jgi:DNA repair protein RadD
MQLRPYQHEAVLTTLAALREGHHPVISLPTGAGKSLVLAALCHAYVRVGYRVMVATHRRELLVQDAAALTQLAPDIASGIYSAGLSRRDLTQPVIFGGIQSCYGRMDELQAAGAFDLIIIDEAHLTPRSADTMYGALFAAVPTALRVGLTATPYRLDSGLLYQGEGAMFDLLALHIEPKTLIPDYLAPLVGVGTEEVISTEGVHSARGDFVTNELEQQALDEHLIRESVREAIRLAQGRTHWLVFCITVAHAEAVTAELRFQGVDAALVTGETKKEERDSRIRQYKDGTLTALVNCNVLTTGFDAPHTDCLVMLRPTQSKGLWEQMLGRGMRKHPGKENCQVLDFAGNILRHGAIGLLEEYLPSQREQRADAERKVRADAMQRAIAHATRASQADPMSEDTEARELLVRAMRYSTAPSKKYEGKQNLIAEYQCLDLDTEDARCLTKIRQFVCLEYPGGAGWHARNWFRRRGILNPPQTAGAARTLAATLPMPTGLRVVKSKGFWNVQLERWNEEAEAEAEVFA